MSTDIETLKKEELLHAALKHVNDDLWETEDGQRYGWVWVVLEALDQELNNLHEDELKARLRFLYKRIAAVKGRRGHSDTVRARLKAWLAATDASTETNSTPETNADSNTNANAQPKGDTMPVYVDVRKEVLVSRGEHLAKIVAVSQPQKSKFEESKESVKLTFELISGKFIGERLTKYYTLSTEKKSNLGQLYRRLVCEPKVGRVDIERDLVGRSVSLVITHKDGDDGPYAVIQDVFKPDSETVAAT